MKSLGICLNILVWFESQDVLKIFKNFHENMSDLFAVFPFSFAFLKKYIGIFAFDSFFFNFGGSCFENFHSLPWILGELDFLKLKSKVVSNGFLKIDFKKLDFCNSVLKFSVFFFANVLEIWDFFWVLQMFNNCLKSF